MMFQEPHKFCDTRHAWDADKAIDVPGVYDCDMMCARLPPEPMIAAERKCHLDHSQGNLNQSYVATLWAYLSMNTALEVMNVGSVLITVWLGE